MTDDEINAKLSLLKIEFEGRLKLETERVQLEFEKTLSDKIDTQLQRYVGFGAFFLALVGIGGWAALPGKITDIAQNAVTQRVKDEVNTPSPEGEGFPTTCSSRSHPTAKAVLALTPPPP